MSRLSLLLINIITISKCIFITPYIYFTYLNLNTKSTPSYLFVVYPVVVEVSCFRHLTEIQRSQGEMLKSQGVKLDSLNLRFDSSLIAIGIVIAIFSFLGNIGKFYDAFDTIEKYNNKRR